jgi:hypothetical protein
MPVQNITVSPAQVNAPAPIVNVKIDKKGKVTKTVERDENGLITGVTENEVDDVEGDK